MTVLEYFEKLLEEAGKITAQRFQVTLEDLKFSEYKRKFFASRFPQPNKILLSKLVVRRAAENIKEDLDRAAELLDLNGIRVSDTKASEYLELPPGEINEAGAKKFWATRVLEILIAIPISGTFYSPLSEDIETIEQAIAKAEVRDTEDLREEEKEELRIKLARSIIDVKNFLKQFDQKRAGGQFN